MKSWSAHRWFVLVLFVGLVLSLGVWWSRQDILPGTLRIATAEPGGLHHRFGSTFAEELERRTGRRVELVPTHGSRDNMELLSERRGGWLSPGHPAGDRDRAAAR